MAEHTSIVVYRVLSDDGLTGVNINYQVIKALTEIGVIQSASQDVYRDGSATITVYNYEKAD